MILGLWALGFYVTQSYDCPAPDVCLRMTGLHSAAREGFRARALMTSLANREPSSCLFEACGMIDVLYDLLDAPQKPTSLLLTAAPSLLRTVPQFTGSCHVTT